MCVWLLLCIDPLVYSYGRDVLNVTLVLVMSDMHLLFQVRTTALMETSELGKLKYVKMVLDRGADVNLQDIVSTVYDYFNISWRHVHSIGVWCVGLLWGHSKLILPP